MVSSNVECTNPACELKEDNGATLDSNMSKQCALVEKCASSCAAYGRVCPCAARAAARKACDAVKKLSVDSKIFQGKPDLEHFDNNDLVIGTKLGEGGFSLVHEVDVKGRTLAVKYLKRQCMVEQYQFEHGAADLAVEAHFLAHLDHPNIVKIRGVTAGSVETNVATGKECGFFILIDRLFCTLEQKIKKWKEEADQNKGGMLYRQSSEYKEKRKNALFERLKLGKDIAKALEYLHNKKIIYRDLKPDNIGFDKDGTLKLFDFGLARELKAKDELENGTYKLTGNTGSRRYMSPEVARSQCYDLSVDVYSFGILLWELCALEKPYFGYSASKHMQQVVLGGERPKLDTSNTSWWPVDLQWLLKKCWSSDTSNRPGFDIIQQVLQCIIDEAPNTIRAKEQDVPVSVVAPKSSGGWFRRAKTVTGTPSTDKKEVEYDAKKLAPPPGGFASMQKPSMGTKRNLSLGRRRRTNG